MLIDTHAHLDLISTDSENIKSILEKCKKARISVLFNISVNYKSNLISVQLSEKYENIYFSVGIHPSEADYVKSYVIDEIKKNIFREKCIGIGEIGIDLYRKYSKIENQRELFEIFLNIAKEYKKPVIIHSRESFKEIYKMITKNEYQDIKGVFHCFSYSYKEAKKIIDKAYLVSFAGNLTYKRAYNLHETAKKIPLEHIILETDSPYLAPVPFRGKKNYPYNVIYIYKFLSSLKGVPLENIVNQINDNVRKFFNISTIE